LETKIIKIKRKSKINVIEGNKKIKEKDRCSGETYDQAYK
jgi:hypothetical protein